MYNKISSLEEHLVGKGYRLTQNRKDILKTFLQFDSRWITAQELFDKVSTKNKKINFSTVYRNLEMLTKIKVLCKVDKGHGMNYYMLNNCGHHHHHLICKSCGKTCTIDFCPLKELHRDHLKGFTVVDHRFEVYGYCHECRKGE